MKNVLFITSEAVPFIKTGGLADVCGTLPRHIDKRSFDVRVIMPKYAGIKEELKQKLEYKFNFYMNLGWRNAYVGVFEAKIDNIIFYFIDNEFYFNAPTPYSEVSWDTEKFAFFSKAALSCLPMLNFKPDIIHCHDWQASLAPVYLEGEFKQNDFYKNVKTVLTIHNLKFQGRYNIGATMDLTGLSGEYFTADKLEAWGDSNLLKGGIVYSNKVTTVSKTYADEIQTDFYGEGLQSVLRARSGELIGIVNGIDYDEFNPQKDKNIPFAFSKKDLSGKAKNKLELQKELGLKQDENVLLLGMVSRLTDQKGFDLVAHVFDELANQNVQIVILGTGEKQYEDMFKHFAGKYPQTVSASICYSEALSHKIYASCDAFLMPSLFEPCGLAQMMSLRYGTLPIVRETGGLKDTVEAYNEFEQTGTGFSFANYNAHEMLDTVKYAIKTYYDNRKAWDKMVVRAMEKDFSWRASAKEYEKLYKDLLK